MSNPSEPWLSLLSSIALVDYYSTTTATATATATTAATAATAATTTTTATVHCCLLSRKKRDTNQRPSMPENRVRVRVRVRGGGGGSGRVIPSMSSGYCARRQSLGVQVPLSSSLC